MGAVAGIESNTIKLVARGWGQGWMCAGLYTEYDGRVREIDWL